MVESSPKYKINYCDDGIQRACFVFVNWDYEGTLNSAKDPIPSLSLSSATRDEREAVEFFTDLGYAMNVFHHPTKRQMQ